MQTRTALKNLNRVPSAKNYRAALFSNGTILYSPLNGAGQPLDKDGLIARLLRGWGLQGWELDLSPEDLQRANELLQFKLVSRTLIPLNKPPVGMYQAPTLEEAKKSLFKYHQGLAKKFRSWEELPDEDFWYNPTANSLDSVDVDVDAQTISLDAAWRQHMTRRPSDNRSKSYVMPSGDVSFSGRQPDLLKVLAHLVRVDTRVTSEFQIVGAERYRGQTVADLLKEKRDTDKALGGGGGAASNAPIVAYHGTSMARWKAIQSKGLVPNMQGKVYMDLVPGYSDQNVYLALHPEEAENYATRQAIWDKAGAVVLKVVVRDLTKLVADEDAINSWVELSRPFQLTISSARSGMGHPGEVITMKGQVHTRNVMTSHGQGTFKQDAEYKAFYEEVISKGMGAFLRKSVRAGTFGYRGRIPARDISVFMEYKRQAYPPEKELTFEEFQRVRKEVQDKAKRPEQDKGKKPMKTVQRLASRYLGTLRQAGTSAKLDQSTRSKINRQLQRLGAYYQKPQKGFSVALDVLVDHGIEQADVTDSFIFTRDEGRITVDLAFINPEDSFSPTAITNAMLVVSFTKLSDNRYEVLSYVS